MPDRQPDRTQVSLTQDAVTKSGRGVVSQAGGARAWGALAAQGTHPFAKSQIQLATKAEDGILCMTRLSRDAAHSSTLPNDEAGRFARAGTPFLPILSVCLVASGGHYWVASVGNLDLLAANGRKWGSKLAGREHVGYFESIAKDYTDRFS